MEPSFTRRDTGRASGRASSRARSTKTDYQIGPDQLNHKRRRSIKDKDENEDPTRQTPKSPTIKESRSKKLRRTAENDSLPQSPRQSPRLKEIRDLDQQRISRTGKRTRSSPNKTKAYQLVAQQQTQAERGILGTSRKSEQTWNPEDEDEGQPESSPTKPEAQKSKQRQNIITRQSTSRLTLDKEDLIQDWLDKSCWSRRTSADNGSSFEEMLDKMSSKSSKVLPWPDNSSNNGISSSKRSESSTARVNDSDYRNSLSYRKIYIENHYPPVELIRRAEEIISRSRASPEMDDVTIQKLRDTSRRVQNEAEKDIVRRLGSHIIPTVDDQPNQKLALKTDQLWCNSVPIPLDPDILTKPLPLPKPKPDLAFGYSEAAFTHKQLTTIDLLVDDQCGRSYAVPDQNLRFPFLNVEFKSQAKSGTHYVATNQAAGTGAIALNGYMKLIQGSFGIEDFDYDEPQFFSITMDHEYARINVHWLNIPVKGEQYNFHMEGLSRYFLRDASGLRAVTRAVKNILDYGADARLQLLCRALDTYREKFTHDSNAPNPQKAKI